MKSRVFAVFVAMILVACSEPPVDPQVRGAELLAPFKAELKEALVAGMQDGPAAAIEICSEKAPEIAAGLSVNGVTMGRSSHKLRNPENAPPQWLELSDEPLVVDLGGGRHGYAEPIFIQPLCLTCHGENLSSEIAARLNERYPHDQATNYREGDLRGVFWVEF